MQEWKMTDKLLANCEHNYGVWKMQDWKMTDKLLANSGQNYGVWKMQRAIPKGRCFMYAYDSQLYRQVKKVGRVRYLKCTIEHCDGSAKLDNGQNHDWGKCSV